METTLNTYLDEHSICLFQICFQHIQLPHMTEPDLNMASLSVCFYPDHMLSTPSNDSNDLQEMKT